MKKEETENRDAVKVAIDGELTIQRACKLKEILLVHLKAGKTIDIDLTHVCAIDISGLQLLCSTHKTAINNGGGVHILSPLPAPVAETIRTAGFSRHYDCRPNCDSPCLWKLGDQV
jgi:anti-anti-sigma factor